MSNSDAIPAISPQAIDAFRTASPTLIKETVARSLARTDEVAHHGEDAERLLTAGMEFTVRMLEAAMLTGEIPLLEDELAWAKDRLPHDGVSPEHILSRFKIFREVIISTLPDPYTAEITPFLDWMMARQQEIIGLGNASTE